MTLTVVTPEKKILDSVAIKELLVPGEKGEMGILPGHAPLVSTLGSGVLKYALLKPDHFTDHSQATEQEKFQEIAISWGYVEVQPEKVIVLAESAETKKELDKDHTKRTLKDILKKLEDPKLSPEEIRNLRREEQKQRTFLSLLK